MSSLKQKLNPFRFKSLLRNIPPEPVEKNPIEGPVLGRVESEKIDTECEHVLFALSRFPGEVEGIIDDLIIGLKEAFDLLSANEAILLKEFFIGLGRFTMLKYYFTMEGIIVSARPRSGAVRSALARMRGEAFGDNKAHISEDGKQYGAWLMEQEPLLNHFCTYLVERIQNLAGIMFDQAFLGLSSLDDFNTLITECLAAGPEKSK